MSHPLDTLRAVGRRCAAQSGIIVEQPAHESPAHRLARLTLARPEVVKAVQQYEDGKWHDAELRDLGLAARETLNP